jgi:hypothetical protein
MKLFLAVNCLSDYAPDAPNSCLVELSDSDLARIATLQKLVTEANAYSIEALDCYGTWSNLYVTEVTNDALDDTAIAAIESADCRIEAESLVVRQDGFYFTCVPKHAPDSELCTTSIVPHSALTSTPIYISGAAQ